MHKEEIQLNTNAADDSQAKIMYGGSAIEEPDIIEEDENETKKKPYWNNMNNLSQRFENVMPTIVQVRKNQYDPTAGILYSTGCSLIHLSMFITMFFIKFPDPAEAKKQDEAYMSRLLDLEASIDPLEWKNNYMPIIESNTWSICEDTSYDLQRLMYRSMFAHFFCFFITLYMEVYSAKMQTLGQIMRAMEIFAVVIYFDIVFAGITYYT